MLKISNLPLAPIIFIIILFACGNADPMAGKQVPLALAAKTDTIPAGPEVSKAYLLGKFDPFTHPDFEVVGKPYTDKSGMILRKETLEAFKNMWEKAAEAGISLKIISSTRNFDQQKNIWEGKWSRFAKDAPQPKARALKILEFSSMPGSSRHHWGTDIDLNDLNNGSFEPGGKFEAVYTWLVAHAHEFGFCQPYTAGRTQGYHEEKWHWTYTPLSKSFLAQYKSKVSASDIQGFLGAQLAEEIGAVPYYVLGINTSCAE